jgi:hypothetical protein
VVDTYIKIESSQLDYIRNHQYDIRADLYQGLVDSLHAGEGRAEAVGKRTMMPSSFIGGPCDMRHRYMDAMALVRRIGKPDIFLTMTCNPKWEEIKCELYSGQTPQDRPDLVVWVFKAKLEELKDSVSVRSCKDPKPMSESKLRVPNLDGDARRVHGGLS